MKRNIQMLYTGCLGLMTVFAGCREEVTPLLQEKSRNNEMAFEIVHPSQSIVGARATATAFEKNDRIGLFVTQQDEPLQLAGNYVSNASLTFDGAAWTPDRRIYWDDGKFDIYAYYPYVTSITSVDDAPFRVANDQSGIGYTASDFLWAAQKGTTAGTKPVSLLFKHRMSKLLIRLVKGEDYEGELPTDAEVYIHNTVLTATIDLSVGIVTRNSYGTAQSIRTKKLGEHKYTALLIPQRITNRQPLVEIIMKGVSYLYESNFVFKQGVQHTLSLVISKNPEQIKIEIGGEIENWE